MSISAIRLKNFMAYTDTDWVSINSINLFFGRNSSGKSVILRALRFLKQSLFDTTENAIFAYSVLDGVDIGSFNNLMHIDEKFHVEDHIEFCFELEIDQEVFHISLRFANINNIDKLIKFSVEKITKVDPVQKVFEADWINISSSDQWYFTSDKFKDLYSDPVWESIQIKLRRHFIPTLDIQRVFTNRDEDAFGESFNYINDLVLEFGKQLETFLISIVHIPALRPEPKRTYVLDTAEQKHWEKLGYSGFLRFLRNELSDYEKEEVRMLLRSLKICSNIQAVSLIDSSEQLIAARIVIEESERLKNINLIDVGFGLSQILPIILVSLAASPNSLIIIEEPELHLHPRGQATMADFFAIMSTKNIKFIIETHSEHILLRLRRHIANARLRELQPDTKIDIPVIENFSSSGLTAYYFHRNVGETASSIIPIVFDEMGNIIFQPAQFKDFFSDDTTEIIKMNEAIVKIKSTQTDVGRN